jgi:hypothetical protein
MRALPRPKLYYPLPRPRTRDIKRSVEGSSWSSSLGVGFCYGADARVRTADLLITNQLLYR